MEECDGQLVRGIDLLFFAADARGLRALVFHFDAGTFREHAQRIGKREPFEFHYERDHVAALLAAEALEESAIGMHVERRRLLTVKRAEPHEVAATLAERDVPADESADVGPRENFAFDPFVYAHGLSSFV